MSNTFAIGAGFTLLGVGFVAIDYFIAKLLQRIYPNPNCWDEVLNSHGLSSQERKDLERRKRLYHAGSSHRFRRWGIVLFVVGACVTALAI